ncbi:MAG: OmpH family outer membrane protein [Magnetococcales bacterium]|nr:OmpH family outer membrane protein [Magnetococcales bacterium]
MARWTIAIICVLVAGLVGSQNANAESLKFAYVDVQRAVSSSDAAKKAKELLQKKFMAMRKEINGLELELKRMRSDLKNKQALMKPEALGELRNKARQKYRDYQRLLEDNQAAIDRENKHWTKRITKALREVIIAIGREGKYTTIFGKGQVLYSDSGIDITDMVLVRLNKQTKSWF